jgi:hypothetical protein
MWNIGRSLFPEESRGIATLIGGLLVLAALSIAGAIVYYVAPVTPFTLSIAAAIVILATLITAKHYTLHATRSKNDSNTQPPTPYALILLTTIALAAWWSVILGNPITDAVRSPWLEISPPAIIAPAVAIVISIITLRVHRAVGTLLLFASLFSVFASAAALFPLGYGFDPFLHRATMFHIAEYGTITPKPLYYIGEYALELYANLLGGLSIFTVDTLLVPLLGALALTIAARRLPLGAAIFLLALSNFTTTTPQSLGYIFAILTVATSAATPTERRQFIAPIVFAIAACFAHPIAGVPAIMFVLLTTIRKHLLRIPIIIGSAIALPAMFVLQATINHANIGVLWSNLWRIDLLPLESFFFTNGNPWLDALYLIITNLLIIALIFGVIGAIAKRGRSTSTEHNGGIIALTLVASFILVSLGIDFTYLIAYERQDFALRFLFLATIFALPLIDAGIDATYTHLVTRRMTVPAYLFSIAVVCASVYNLYPRHDGYTRSAAFNVSQADMNTVYAIHALEAEDADYIVLSNQATAAAALQEFGFRKYYHTDIFYYPIPTGGVLYQDYLAMVNETPTRATMEHAMRTAGVHKAYFVVSDYWWQKDAIIEQSKQLTDDWFAVDGGKTTVFVFTDEETSP